jgi:hypothetical protein
VFSVLHHDAIRFANALDTDRSESGITPRRLPLWAFKQIQDPLFVFSASIASGIRIAFSSDTDVVEIDAMLIGVEYADQSIQTPIPRFDLTVNGETVATQQSDAGGRWIVKGIGEAITSYSLSFRAGEPSNIRFENLGRAMKQLEIWLPQKCVVEVRDVRVSTGSAVKAIKPLHRCWVHYGSSISQCGEAEGPTETWPAIVARLVGLDLISLGFGGQCHLDQCVARTIRDLQTDLISLKVGINIVSGDTMRERAFVPALHGFLDTVRDGHLATPLIVITPILYPAGESHPGPSGLKSGRSFVLDRPEELSFGALSIERIRELVTDVVERRRADGDLNLHLLDGRKLFGEEDVSDLVDGLHPCAKGYRRMAERFAALVFGEARMRDALRGEQLGHAERQKE